MPRELTTDQKATLSASLGNEGIAHILIDARVEDAPAYASAFADVFTAKGWSALVESPDGLWPVTPSGLIFVSQGDIPLTGQQEAYLSALTNADIEFNRLDGMIAEGVDIKLMIGRVGV